MSRPDRAEFFAALDAKLDRGEREHGDASFEKTAPALLDELEAEALDLAGWGYILWARLRRLRTAADEVEREANPAPSPALLSHLAEGIEDARAGRTTSRGSFKEYLEECALPMNGGGRCLLVPGHRGPCVGD